MHETHLLCLIIKYSMKETPQYPLYNDNKNKALYNPLKEMPQYPILCECKGIEICKLKGISVNIIFFHMYKKC